MHRLATRPRSVRPPLLADFSVMPLSSTKPPPPVATVMLFSTSSTPRITSALTSAPCAGPPRGRPLQTRAPHARRLGLPVVADELQELARHRIAVLAGGGGGGITATLCA